MDTRQDSETIQAMSRLIELQKEHICLLTNLKDMYREGPSKAHIRQKEFQDVVDCYYLAGGDETEKPKAISFEEMDFRHKRFALVVEAIRVLEKANVVFEDDDSYPGLAQIDSALVALREFMGLPEYYEFSGYDKLSVPF